MERAKIEQAVNSIFINRFEFEAEEFIIYWLPILEENKYNYITLQKKCLKKTFYK